MSERECTVEGCGRTEKLRRDMCKKHYDRFMRTGNTENGNAPKPCGTTAAYKRHLANGEQPCDPCRAAASADRKARYQAARTAPPPPAPVVLSTDPDAVRDRSSLNFWLNNNLPSRKVRA